jgi:pyridoxal phosphate enzyme (YggS family)
LSGAPEPDPGGFAARLARIRARMEAAARRAGRDPESVTLLPVSKTFPVAAIREAVAAGLTCFGESRVQEALPKIEALGPGVTWHLIGHLQRNKAAHAVGAFALIHTLDSERLADRLERFAAERGVVQDVLVEVNIAREPQKSGVDPDGAEGLVRAAASHAHLRVRGLMGMAPYADDPEAGRPHFRALFRLFERMAQNGPKGVTMDTLSMGMSGDFEVAIEEGATLVRIGTALFGEREAA